MRTDAEYLIIGFSAITRRPKLHVELPPESVIVTVWFVHAQRSGWVAVPEMTPSAPFQTMPEGMVAGLMESVKLAPLTSTFSGTRSSH